MVLSNGHFDCGLPTFEDPARQAQALIDLRIASCRENARHVLIELFRGDGADWVGGYPGNDEARQYTLDREVQGGMLAAKQITQEKLVYMLTEITKAQLLALQLGRLKDAGTMTPQQVSLAKRNNVNMACEVAREARRLLGGAERWLRAAAPPLFGRQPHHARLRTRTR